MLVDAVSVVVVVVVVVVVPPPLVVVFGHQGRGKCVISPLMFSWMVLFFFYQKRLKKLGVGVMRSNVPSLGGYIYIGVGVLWSIFLNLYIHLFYM